MYKYRHTVFTPVYNRAKLVHNVYYSLITQDYPKSDYEWLIIDDGSRDGLEEIVSEFIKTGNLNIRYIYKNNGGIHTAMNCAINNALGEFITRIDSDDILCNDALKNKDIAINSIPKDKFSNYVGVVGLCLNKSDKSVRGSKFPFDIIDTTGLDLKKKYKVYGDKNFCMKTEIMRRFLIPEYDDTKWVPESIIWNRIDKEYITRYINVGLSICAEESDDSMMKSLRESDKNKSAYLSIYYHVLYFVNESYNYLSKAEYFEYIFKLLCYGKLSKKYRLRDSIKQLSLNKHRIAAIFLLPLVQLCLIYHKIFK